MSLSQYTDYTAARTNLNAKTSNVGQLLLSKAADPFAVCVTDFRQMNVWFIEVIHSSVNNNAITVKGPGIHLVFDASFIDAHQWVNLLTAWDGIHSADLVDKMNSASIGGKFVSLNKCEICGTFKKNTGSSVFTLNGVLKNNTINPNDDNIIVAMDASVATKVGTLVAFLTTKNAIVDEVTGNISFLNGTTLEGILGKTSISTIE